MPIFKSIKLLLKGFIICLFSLFLLTGNAQTIAPKFRVIAFWSVKSEEAHLSFVHDANLWFFQMAGKYNFTYDSTCDWSKLNSKNLANYEVVIFLDSRPESPEEREAFEKFMEHGGGWMGFHFAGFALTPSEFPQNWDWYHNQFLGSGSWLSNTWRPTSAILRVEDKIHPVTKNLPATFKSSPNEWYRWTNDLRKNPDIKILLSIDSTSFPLGTGPKPDEIWHSGYYPVVWTNKKYHMVYFNMGHNDLDYENKTNRQLSFTFENEIQNKLIIDALLWLGTDPKSTSISVKPK
jgi:hypothetical protein